MRFPHRPAAVDLASRAVTEPEPDKEVANVPGVVDEAVHTCNIQHVQRIRQMKQAPVSMLETTATSAPRPVNDSDLIRAAKAGNPSALGALYERHGNALFNACRRLTGSEADSQDLVHDLFVGLPEALQRYEERGAFGAWLKRIAVRMALMHLRSVEHRRHVPLDQAAAVTTRRRSDDRMEAEDLERAIASLPIKLRMVFVLKRIEGYSHDEIATLLGITPGASRARLTRALDALRRALK